MSLSFLPFTLDNVAISDICNGLILCWCHGADVLYRYVVCNPATKKFKELQPSIHSIGEAQLGFDPTTSSHFHVIEYIEKEQDDECKGVDIYSSKTAAWICKESKWGPNTCVTIERSEEMRSSETMYLNGCLHIMGYSRVYSQILAVDMEGETWRKIHCPRGSSPSIHQAQDHLCVCTVCDRNMSKLSI
jgi:F-box interacting protein